MVVGLVLLKVVDSFLMKVVSFGECMFSSRLGLVYSWFMLIVIELVRFLVMVLLCSFRVLDIRMMGLMLDILVNIGIGCGWVVVMLYRVWLLCSELVKLIVWMLVFLISWVLM